MQCRACLQMNLLRRRSVAQSFTVKWYLVSQPFIYSSWWSFLHMLNSFWKLLSRYVRKVPVCQCSANIGASPSFLKTSASFCKLFFNNIEKGNIPQWKVQTSMLSQTNILKCLHNSEKIANLKGKSKQNIAWSWFSHISYSSLESFYFWFGLVWQKLVKVLLKIWTYILKLR